MSKDVENQRLAAVKEERKLRKQLRRQKELRQLQEERREAVTRWRRNRIEVQNLAKLQLEDEVRALLRFKLLQEKERDVRIKFRRQEMSRKEEERNQELRTKETGELEKEVRLERLRRIARRRLGVHIMPFIRDRFTFSTKVTFNIIIETVDIQFLAILH